MSKKRNIDTSIEVDLTPMIDVTFLMIIFFIIVNDLTQQELEDLKLPLALEAGHDDPPKGRPILNILGCTCNSTNPDKHPPECRIGAIIYKKQALYKRVGWESRGIDPFHKGRPDYYWKLAQEMTRWAERMEHKVDPDHPDLGSLPDEPILIRADRNTPFKYIAKIMETCTREGIRIWRVQLAASEPETSEPKR